MMSNRVTVMVPVNHKYKVAAQVAALTKSAGGATSLPSFGSWFGDDGKEHHESVDQVSWWYGGHVIREVESAVQDLVAALLTAGEECVMVTWLSNQRHEWAELHTLADMES